ncbi:hypothetical protein GGTG_08017 [Gaeumannomyces tritici R3-111a-1]|uniref:Uncharacterized protein n=1 Tax=Gaeumannomyces tritici (strain R3-111a-1) TaxID=644352 RepID=J3P3D0_GAET3|nr:hypothetical protein GGTG_08017 [Gaeumannomyces tritici R3-111a-1]EJT74172.1 hypothetical protein GGTG_08017 [Gaeumannomyces tritici R3-111a-1]
MAPCIHASPHSIWFSTAANPSGKRANGPRQRRKLVSGHVARAFTRGPIISGILWPIRGLELIMSDAVYPQPGDNAQRDTPVGGLTDRNGTRLGDDLDGSYWWIKSAQCNHAAISYTRAHS